MRKTQMLMGIMGVWASLIAANVAVGQIQNLRQTQPDNPSRHTLAVGLGSVVSWAFASEGSGTANYFKGTRAGLGLGLGLQYEYALGAKWALASGLQWHGTRPGARFKLNTGPEMETQTTVRHNYSTLDFTLMAIRTVPLCQRVQLGLIMGGGVSANFANGFSVGGMAIGGPTTEVIESRYVLPDPDPVTYLTPQATAGVRLQLLRRDGTPSRFSAQVLATQQLMALPHQLRMQEESRTGPVPGQMGSPVMGQYAWRQTLGYVSCQIAYTFLRR